MSSLVKITPHSCSSLEIGGWLLEKSLMLQKGFQRLVSGQLYKSQLSGKGPMNTPTPFGERRETTLLTPHLLAGGSHLL